MILNFLPNSIWRKNNTSIWRQKGRPFVCRLIDMLGPLNDSNLFIKAVTTLFSAGLWRCRRKITSSSKCTFRTAPSKIVTKIMRNANYAHKSEIWRDSGNKFVLSVFFSVRPSRNNVCPVSSAHCKSGPNEGGAHKKQEWLRHGLLLLAPAITNSLDFSPQHGVFWLFLGKEEDAQTCCVIKLWSRERLNGLWPNMAPCRLWWQPVHLSGSDLGSGIWRACRRGRIRNPEEPIEAKTADCF